MPRRRTSQTSGVASLVVLLALFATMKLAPGLLPAVVDAVTEPFGRWLVDSVKS